MKIKTCLAESSTVVLSKLELFIGPKKKYQRSGRVFFLPSRGQEIGYRRRSLQDKIQFQQCSTLFKVLNDSGHRSGTSGLYLTDLHQERHGMCFKRSRTLSLGVFFHMINEYNVEISVVAVRLL